MNDPAWSRYSPASRRIPPDVTPWDMEVLLALLWAEQCERLSVACRHHSLSSEAGSSDVCCVAGLTWSRELGDRSLPVAQRVVACFLGGRGWFSLWLVDGAAFPLQQHLLSLGSSCCVWDGPLAHHTANSLPSLPSAESSLS